MNSTFQNLIVKYQSLKKINDLEGIESLSNILNNELLYLVKQEYPTFLKNYEELINRSENMISRGYKFEFKDNLLNIYSPHNPQKNKQRKLINPNSLLSFINEDDEELSSLDKEFLTLFLSNSNSIMALNFAINLF